MNKNLAIIKDKNKYIWEPSNGEYNDVIHEINEAAERMASDIEKLTDAVLRKGKRIAEYKDEIARLKAELDKLKSEPIRYISEDEYIDALIDEVDILQKEKEELKAEIEQRPTNTNELDIYVLTDTDGDLITAFSEEGKAQNEAKETGCCLNKIKCHILAQRKRVKDV